MLHTLSVWLLAAAFLGAGVFNAIGTPATRAGFARWGYPTWWHRVTGGLEILCAALILLPPARPAGLALAAIIMAAALLTLLRHREYAHLPPVGVFFALIAAAAFSA